MKANNNTKFVHISRTKTFSRLKIFPEDEYQMKYFLLVHSVKKYYPKIFIKNVTSNYDAEPLQLDSLFYLCRTVVLYEESLKVNLKKYFDQKLPEANFGPEVEKLISSDITFYLIDNLIAHWKPDTTFEMCNNSFADTLQTIFLRNKVCLLSNDPVENINLQRKIINNITENPEKIQLVFLDVYNKIIEFLDQILPMGKKILLLCSKGILESDDVSFLTNFNSDCTQSKFDDSDGLIQSFYELIGCDFYEYDLFNNQPSNNFSDYNNGPTKELSEAGYKLISKFSYFHTIVDCLTELDVSNKTDLTSLLGNIMITEKDTVGYINKYDITTLADYFIINSIANNTDLSYDKAIESLTVDNNFPLLYPLEIALRIFSRFFGIVFYLHINKITDNPVLIDNTIDTINKIVFLFQYSPDCVLVIERLDQNSDLVQSKESNTNCIPNSGDELITNSSTDKSEIINDLTDIVYV